MKNKISKLIFAFILFFVISLTAKADHLSFEVGVLPNTTWSFFNNNILQGVECPGIGSLQYFDAEIDPNTGHNKVSLKSGVESGKATETLNCTYKIRRSRSDGGAAVVDYNGTVDFKFTYDLAGGLSPRILNINQSISKYNDTAYFEDLMAGSVIGLEIKTSGWESLIENNCVPGSGSCNFKLKPDAYSGGAGSTMISGTITTDAPQQVNFNLEVITYVRINALTRGECDLPAGWSVSGHSTSGSAYKYLMDTPSAVTLPTCKAKNDFEEVYGWVYINPTDKIQSSDRIQMNNYCAEYPTTDGSDMATLSQQGVEWIFMCYKSKGFININPAGSKVDVNLGTANEYGVYRVIADTFTLPNVTETPGEKFKFAGWEESSTGQLRQPGYVVSEAKGQTYTAIYQTEITSVINQSEYGNLFVGDETRYYITGVTFTQCASEDTSKLEVALEDGACRLKAVAETGEEEYVKVTAISEGREYVRYINIITRSDKTTGNAIKFDEYAISGYDSNGVPTNIPKKKDPYSTGDVDSTNEDGVCDAYYVKTLYSDHGDELYMTAMYAAHYKINGSSAYLMDFNDKGQGIDYTADDTRFLYVHHDSFRATCATGTGDKTDYAANYNSYSWYPTICLDPTAYSPGGGSTSKILVVDEKPDKEIKDFLYYAIQNGDKVTGNANFQKELVETYASDYTNTRGTTAHSADAKNHTRIAVTFVSRLLAAKNGLFLNVKESEKGVNLSYYGYVYKAISEEVLGKSGVDLYSMPDLNTGISNYNGWYTGTSAELDVTQVREIANAFIKDIKAGKTSGFAAANVEEVKQDKPTVTGTSEDGKNVLLIQGSITLPSDVVDSDIDWKKTRPICYEGVDCNPADFKMTRDGDKYTFQFKAKYSDDKKAQAESADNVTLQIVFNSYKANSSVVFLRPQGSQNTQKMAIFKKEQIYTFKYGVTNMKSTCDIDEYENWFSSMSKEEFEEKHLDQFNADHCCNNIFDQSSELFQNYCQTTCVKKNFALACDPSNVENYDIYTVNESKVDGEDQYSTCIVDVERTLRNGPEARKQTNEKIDAVTNPISVESYKGNGYCAVSCKEDWTFKTSAFKNFVGLGPVDDDGTYNPLKRGSVFAGSYFKIDEDLYIGGARTCVTTYIDYERYDDDVYVHSGKIIAAKNAYLEFSMAYQSLFDNMNALGAPGKEKYYTRYEYVKSGGRSEPCDCHYEEDKTTGEKKEVCNKTCYYADYKVTPVVGYDKTCVKHYTSTVAPKQTVEDKYLHPNNTGNTESIKLRDVGDKYYVENNPTEDIDDHLCGFSSGSCEDNLGYAGKDWCRTDYGYHGDPDNLSQDGAFGIFINEIPYSTNNSEYTSFDNSSPYIRNSLYDRTQNMNITGYYASSGIIPSTMPSFVSTIDSEMLQLNQKVDQMNECQNFYLNNTSTDTNNEYHNGSFTDEKESSYSKGLGYKVLNSIGIPNLTETPKEIASPYQPDVRYQYEEYDYMTLIGDKNIVISNAKLNNSYKADGETTNNWCVDVGDYKAQDGSTVKLKVCKNKFTALSYKSENGWAPVSDEAYKYADGTEKKTEKPGNLGPDGGSGAKLVTKKMSLCKTASGAGKYSEIIGSTKCSSTEFYYYEANYIKETLENGGFYRNYGEFYDNAYSDLKIHATSPQEAYSLASSRGSTEKDWTVLGGINVFPIGIDTRRNIYQYMYSFGNIGQYQDGKLGRVIGGYQDAGAVNTSTATGGQSQTTNRYTVVQNHTHTCFYEVLENLCVCCGYPITTQVVFPSGVDTQTYLKDYPYTFSNNNVSSTGTLGFYNSTVSLYDLDGVAGTEDLASNWTKDDEFFIYGNTYTTDKGGYLAKNIVDIGDKVYERTPEYSYTLTPAAITSIRSYNDKNGYEINVDNLVRYGICAYASDTDECKETATGDATNGSETIRFVHYGSKFLENYVDEYVTESSVNYLSKRKSSNNICKVDGATLSSMSETIDLMKSSGTYGNCRWVDYVMTDLTPVKGDPNKPELKGKKVLRLAFK